MHTESGGDGGDGDGGGEGAVAVAAGELHGKAVQLEPCRPTLGTAQHLPTCNKQPVFAHSIGKVVRSGRNSLAKKS